MDSEHEADAIACRALWAAVLCTALEDAQGRMDRKDYRQPVVQGLRHDAARWLASADTGIGSFLWICMLLDLEPGRVRTAFAERGTSRMNPSDTKRYHGHRPLEQIDFIEYAQAMETRMVVHLSASETAFA